MALIKPIIGGEKIKTNYQNIEDNDNALNDDIGVLGNQLTEILNETDLDPNKDPEVTNARNSSVFGTAATVKENIDTGHEFSLTPKMLGGGYIINGNFDVNQREVTGSVVLPPFGYGHDRWRAGGGGCEYTFATFQGKTTITITSGTLQQIIEKLPLTSNYILSWEGTTQGKLGTVGFLDSPIIASRNGGTEVTLEFGIGTIAKVKLETGDKATDFISKTFEEELRDCKYYYRRIKGGTQKYIGFGHGAGAADTTRINLFRNEMRTNPTFGYSNLLDFLIVSNVSLTVNGMSIFGFAQDYQVLTVTATGTVAGAFYQLKLDAAGWFELDAEL